ncbi:MAG: (d)CMP kinase [Oscillospiraceae bacterium]
MIAVAIDGPSGAGKSTLARAAAKELGYIYVDTGACYRAVGLFALEKGIDPGDEAALEPLLPEAKVELVHRDGEQRVLLNGRDVSEAIRAPEMGEAASKVSALPSVRAFLLNLQRDMAARQNVIMDGRDIGTVVLPDAQVKIFLTASDEERARRRYEEFVANGQEISYNKVLEDMRSRDARDAGRETAPLREAADAIRIDSTGNAFEKTLSIILQTIWDKIL